MLLEENLLHDDPSSEQQPLILTSSYSVNNCLVCNDNFESNRVCSIKQESNHVDTTAVELEKMYRIFCAYMNIDCIIEDNNIAFDFQTEIFPFCNTCKSSLASLLKLHTDFKALENQLNKLVGNLTFKVLETWRQTNRKDEISATTDDQSFPIFTTTNSLPSDTLTIADQLPDNFEIQNVQAEPNQNSQTEQESTDGGGDSDKAHKKVSNVRELIFNCFNAKVLVTKLGADSNVTRPKFQSELKSTEKRPRGRPRKASIQVGITKQLRLRPKRTKVIKHDDFWESNFEDENTYAGLDEDEWLPENTEQRKEKKQTKKPTNVPNHSKLDIKGELDTEDTLMGESASEQYAEDTQANKNNKNESIKSGKVKKVKRKGILKKSKISLKKSKKLDPNKNEPTFQRVIEVSPNRFLYRNQFYYEKLPDQSRFRCCLCGIETVHKKAMLDHLRRRRVKTCDKKKLPRSFICELCGKSFNRKDHFKEHLLTHLDVRSFLCSECGNTFKTKTRLQVHSLIHRGEEAKKYQCKSCGKKFLKNSFLKTHALSHTGEKLSECPECHKKFSRRCHMIRHMKSVHVEIKPYGCPIENCHKRYTQNHTLRRHMLVVHFSDAKKTEGAPANSEHKSWSQVPVEEDILPFLPVATTTTLTSTEITGENIENPRGAEASHFLFFPQTNFKLAN